MHTLILHNGILHNGLCPSRSWKEMKNERLLSRRFLLARILCIHESVLLPYFPIRTFLCFLWFLIFPYFVIMVLRNMVKPLSLLSLRHIFIYLALILSPMHLFFLYLFNSFLSSLYLFLLKKYVIFFVLFYFSLLFLFSLLYIFSLRYLLIINIRLDYFNNIYTFY